MNFSWTSKIRISRFLMLFGNVKVWFASGDVKEPVGHLKNDWEWLEIGFPLAWETRFFEFENRVLRAIFPLFLDRYASHIYTGWIWSGFGKESINIQSKSNLIIVQNQIFKIWLIFNPILPYWSNFEIAGIYGLIGSQESNKNQSSN